MPIGKGLLNCITGRTVDTGLDEREEIRGLIKIQIQEVRIWKELLSAEAEEDGAGFLLKLAEGYDWQSVTQTGRTVPQPDQKRQAPSI